MTYWHMQMHPNDKNRDEEYQILDRGYIGLGDWDDKRPTSQIIQFKDEMKKGDIVLIKRGEKPFALVEIIGDSEQGDGVGGNDWIYYKRDVKLLDKDVLDMPSFPQPRGTLQKSINPKTATYKYIDSWYKQFSYAIKSVYIENNKMFQDLEVKFIDEKNNALPIIIIAGINGSGKTTLLEYINEMEEFVNNTIYIPAGIDEINEIANEYVLTFYDFLKNKDYRPSEVREHLDKYMQNIFNDFDLTFKYSHLDKEDNVWFINDSGVILEINDLSLGEKTLLSKILYLFFKGYREKIILIDEPELSLHPSWQNKILSVYEKLAKQNNCQIIIATHSPHIIGSADNKYIRFLEKNEEGNVFVINDVQAYGRDIEWVLQQMGVENFRVSEVLEKFTNCQQLLNDEKYDEAEICIDSLEEEIGQNDKQIMNLRNSLFFERD